MNTPLSGFAAISVSWRVLRRGAELPESGDDGLVLDGAHAAAISALPHKATQRERTGLQLRTIVTVQGQRLLVALVAALKEEGIEVVGGIDEEPNGKFAWILDPEGNKRELWQPIDSDADPYLAED